MNKSCGKLILCISVFISLKAMDPVTGEVDKAALEFYQTNQQKHQNFFQDLFIKAKNMRSITTWGPAQFIQLFNNQGTTKKDLDEVLKNIHPKITVTTEDDNHYYKGFWSSTSSDEYENPEVDTKIQKWKDLASKGKIALNDVTIFNTLKDQYKIHPCPKPGEEYSMLLAIIKAATINPHIQDNFCGVKIIIDSKLKDARHQAWPIIVIYPKKGQDRAELLINHLDSYFKNLGIEGDTSTKLRFNMIFNNNVALRYCQGDRDHKKTANDAYYAQYVNYENKAPAEDEGNLSVPSCIKQWEKVKNLCDYWRIYKKVVYRDQDMIFFNSKLTGVAHPELKVLNLDQTNN